MKTVPLVSLIVLLAGPVNLLATPPSYICMTGECHPGLSSAAYIHGPIAGGSCPLCHDEGKKSKSLPEAHPAVFLGPVSDKCLLCHEEIGAVLKLGSVHTPVADGECIDCHDPHQADNDFFLKAPPRMERGLRIVAPSCKSCHKPHDPDWFNNFHASEATLDCVVCHNAHASAEAYQLTRYVKEVYVRVTIEEGEDLQAKGKLEAAATAFGKALAVMPKNADLHNRIGLIHTEKKQYQEALSAFTRAIEANPDFAPAHGHIAEVFEALGKKGEAQKARKRYQELQGK